MPPYFILLVSIGAVIAVIGGLPLWLAFNGSLFKNLSFKEKIAAIGTMIKTWPLKHYLVVMAAARKRLVRQVGFATLVVIIGCGFLLHRAGKINSWRIYDWYAVLNQERIAAVEHAKKTLADLKRILFPPPEVPWVKPKKPAPPVHVSTAAPSALPPLSSTQTVAGLAKPVQKTKKGWRRIKKRRRTPADRMQLKRVRG